MYFIKPFLKAPHKKFNVQWLYTPAPSSQPGWRKYEEREETKWISSKKLYIIYQYRFYIVSYYIKWVTTSWTQSTCLHVVTHLFVFCELLYCCLLSLHTSLYNRYHHVTVLVYSWYSFTEYASSSRWFVFMNYAVHSTMYSYYACRALR